MCRNIKTLHNFKPPATEDEIRASSVQFVRKLSGFTRPSKANQPAFDRAVEQVAAAARELLQALVTNAPPRDREVEASRARARTADRFRSSEASRPVQRVRQRRCRKRAVANVATCALEPARGSGPRLPREGRGCDHDADDVDGGQIGTCTPR
jgi:hypothetical protein